MHQDKENQQKKIYLQGEKNMNENRNENQGVNQSMNSVRESITERSDSRGIGSNRMGIAPSGVIFTITSAQICEYMDKYFADKGLPGIQTVANIRSGNRLEFFAVIATNDRNVNKNDTIGRVFGDTTFSRVGMNAKLREVLNTFISDDVPYLSIAEKNNKFCYATLDYTKIFRVCLDIDINTQYIDIIDVQTISKKTAIMRIAKLPLEAPKGPDLEDLIRGR